MFAANPTAGDIAMIITILVLLVLLIFMSVAEMGLSRISKPKASAIAERGAKGGPALLRLVSDPAHWVNPLLLSVNICQTVQATLTGVVAGRLFGAPGVIIGVVLNVLVFYVLAEAVPKTYAVLYPERASLLTSRPTLALVAFPPLRVIATGLIKLTNVIVRGKGLQEGPFVSEQELLGIVEVAADDEVIEQEERQLIESIIEFGDTVVREIMVPSPDMVTVSSDATVSSALDVAINEGFSRMPVLNAENDQDDVVGVLYAKDLMRAERQGLGVQTVMTLVRQVRVIPENKPVARLMREMQAEKFHLAIVADEYGSIAGMVTLEDCLEELVGEIVDEHDTEDAEIEHLANGEYLVEGSVSVADINELLAVNIPDEEWDTVGGFIFGTLEHVPEVGESVLLDGWRFVAHEVDGRRIRKVRIVAEVIER